MASGKAGPSDTKLLGGHVALCNAVGGGVAGADRCGCDGNALGGNVARTGGAGTLGDYGATVG